MDDGTLEDANVRSSEVAELLAESSLGSEQARVLQGEAPEAAANRVLNQTARRRVFGQKARQRCCQALLVLLESRPETEDFAQTVVHRQEIQQIAQYDSPSTLYATFGTRGRNSLAGTARDGEWPRRGVMDHLTAETKVWSFTSYRSGWLDELERDDALQKRLVAETLVLTVADWAARNPRLAALGGHTPPQSAVEDLEITSVGSPDRSELTALLSKVIALAVGPRGTSPMDVLTLVHTDLMTILGFRGSVHLDETMRTLARALGEIEYMLPKLGSADWDQMAGALSPRLAEVLRAIAVGE